MHAEPDFRQVPFVLRRARAGDVAALRAFAERNAEHLGPTSPRRPPDFHSDGFWAQSVARGEDEFKGDQRVSMYVFEHDRIVGMVNLMNIVRGALQGCDLGYAIDREYQGKGLMYWAVQAGLSYAFGTLGLHRVQANHLPDNHRSARLLARLGFRREGLAQRFLLIDGAWRDHVMTALVYDAWRPKPGEEFALDGAAGPRD
jgi:ribosomal-protein-alanine N-acetyltransferase